MPRKPKTAEEKPTEFQSFTVRIPVDLHRALRVVAADENTSINEKLTQILQEWWQEKPDRRRFEEFLRTRR